MSGPLGASYWKELAGRAAKGIGDAYRGSLICPDDDAALDYHPEHNNFTCPACARTYIHIDNYLAILPANDPYGLGKDAIARLAEQAASTSDAGPQPATLERVDRITRDISGKRVLDLCCGRGEAARHFADRGARVAALDIVATVGGLASVPPPTNGGIDRFQADACRLPFAPELFDVVFASDCIHAMPRPERMMLEAARVLAPDGIFISANEPVGRGSLSLGEDPRAGGRKLSLRDYSAIFSEVRLDLQPEKDMPIFVGRRKPAFSLPKIRLPWRKKK